MLHRFDLFHYQTKIVKFIIETYFGAVWADMGLGKTIGGLTAYLDLVAAGDVGHALVGAPKRVASKVWSDEIDAWSHTRGLTVAKILGSEKQRRDALNQKADIHLFSRDHTVWLEEQFIKGKRQIRKWPWELVFLDESQSWKNQSAKRWKSMRRMRRLCQRMIHLTGTPSPNGYGDLWGQYFLLDYGQRLGKAEGAFEQRWFDPPGYGKYSPTIKEGAAKEIQSLIKDITLSMRAEDYLDLPPVRVNPIKVKLSAEMLAKYKRFERTFVLERMQRDEHITALNTAALSQKLLQLASGAVYYDDKRNFEVFHDEKIEALLEALEFIPPPILIGHTFHSDKIRIAAALDRLCKGTRKQWKMLKSDDSLTSFRAGLVDYGIIHPGSAGHGLNDLHISGSENIIWFGPTNNLEYFDQLNARLMGGHRRIGKNVTLHHILTEGTVDMDMIALLEKKDRSQNDLTRAMADYSKRILQ